MKIVHVVDHYHPALGYQESALAGVQAEAGHCVTVVTGDRPLPTARSGERFASGDRVEAGVRVIRLPVRFAAPGRAGRNWLVGLEAALGALAPDAVHCHNMLTLSAWRVARAKRALRFRLVCDSHHAPFNAEVAPAPRLRLQRALNRALGRAVLPAADALVAIGDDEQTYLCDLLGLSPERVAIIRLGADREALHVPPEARARRRAAWGARPEEVLLVHAGALRPGKNIPDLIEAARRLLAEGAPLRAVVAGGATAQEMTGLRARARVAGLEGRFHLPGHVPRSDLAGYFAAADVAVWPGDPSIAFLNALAVGLPLVIADSRYARGTAQAAGLYFPRGDVAALTGCLQRLVASPELRAQMGAAARARVLEELNWETAARRFERLYRGDG